MNKVAELLQLFYDGKLSKLQTEKELSLILGGSWILALVNGEYIPAQYHDVEPELVTDDYDDWVSNTL